MVKLPAPTVASFELTPLQRLTKQQRSILKLAAAGYTEAQTATELNVALKTIKFHKTNMYKTLQVKNIVQAVLLHEREIATVVTELNSRDYVAEFARLNNMVSFLRDELELERSKTIKYQLELEKIQTGKRSEFKILPSNSVSSFSAKITGVPK